MIKQPETRDKLVFGVDFATRQKRVQKEKPVAPSSMPKHPCQFQVFVPGLDSCNRSKSCQNEALESGWCKDHQDAQIGMDLGAKINYRSIEIPIGVKNGSEEFKIVIGQGEKNWLEYFGKARKPGLDTVLNYLKKRIESIQ